MAKRAMHVVAGILSYDARVKSYLAMLTNAGWRVDVICYEEPGKPFTETIGEVRVFRVSPKYQGKSILRYLHAYRQFYKKAKKLLKKLHSEEPYDMIHINNMPNFLIGMITNLKPNPHVILDMHDVMSINYKTKFGGFPLAVKLTELEEKWSLRKADTVSCADHGQKEALETLHGFKDAHVIMNLANPEIFKWSDHTWKGGKFRFVYSGTIAHRLGVDRAAKALSNLPDHIVLRVIGDGDGLDNLRKVIKDNGLEERVELIPRVPVEQIPGLLKDCHAGVIPSRKTEATDKVMMPVKFMEYCAVGLPSVVSNLSNLRRYVNEEHALFFKPENDNSLKQAMMEIVQNLEKRQDICENIKDLNKEYAWEISSSIYKSLLNH